jgi:hypothetical protein
MRILGLVIPDDSTAAYVATRYNVPTYASDKALLLDFPPQDYSALVDVDTTDDDVIPSRSSSFAQAGQLVMATTRRKGPGMLDKSLSLARRWRPSRRRRSGGPGAGAA